MSIRFCECNGVVAVPSVEDSLLCVAWDGAGLVEGGLAVVRFPGGMLVELLEVDSSPERPVLLGADHHAVAPSIRGSQGDLLQHAQADVSVQTCFHFILPVDGDAGWSVAGFGDCCGIDAQRERRASHHWEWLMFAYVERTC